MNKPHLLCCLLLNVSLSSAFALSSPVKATHGMVVSEQGIASVVGVEVLRAGGNAIDAAVAVAYALAVVEPCCGNIGGGGFMLIHLANGKNVFINFREKAPLAASPDMHLDQTGYLSVGVPGTVLGLETALAKYGSMKREALMTPAIQLAENGYFITPFQEKLLKPFTNAFRKQSNVAAIFLKNGEALLSGDLLIQRDLARTLKLIAKEGTSAFYRGPIAKAIVDASEKNGGMLTLKDFKDYQVEELTPIYCQYRSYDIISAPPPSSGGVTLCEMLSILENFPLKEMGFHRTQTLFAIIEAMRYGYRDRKALGDPDFIQNPITSLTSKTYTKALAEKIKLTQMVLPGKERSNFREQFETTHFSIMDQQGNAVALTYTLNGFFGSLVMADHTGFFLNNEMDDFVTNVGTGNQVQGGKRPLSSMTPTMVMKDGKVLMVLGSPGGPRIITAVLLTILNVLDNGMNIQAAVDAPRIHYQGTPDILYVEPFALSFLNAKLLEKRGFVITPQGPWAAVEAIYVDTDGSLLGANDYRRPDGGAFGY